MNHIQNSSENKDDCDNSETKRKSDFLLMYSKKCHKKQNTGNTSNMKRFYVIFCGKTLL